MSLSGNQIDQGDSDQRADKGRQGNGAKPAKS